ncbi:MAG: nucleotidyltransferase domain-containing protein [Bacteroidota bacterium]
MRESILEALHQLEQEANIHILYAVESGSRAWGFASPNSDWDVRFVYLHRPEWYLSIQTRKDTIERMLPQDLDLSGWELRKALNLFRKSNPPLLEWLGSPIVYRNDAPWAAAMQQLLAQCFNPKSCSYHYLSMAKGNFREYLKGDTVRLKKYLYILRPLLACDWIAQEGGMPPTEFHAILNQLHPAGELREAIDALLERKMAAEELSVGPQIPVINAYAAAAIERHEERLKDFRWDHRPQIEPLNELFRETLWRVFPQG